jgi:membrane protein implicated in regulation of membrane protease activity
VDLTWIWLIGAVVLVGVELVTGGTIVFGMLAGGAAAAAGVSALGGGPIWSTITFAAVSAVLLFVIRPIARRHRRPRAAELSGVAALVGREAVVLEEVHGGDGRVKLAGEIWSARSYDGSTTFPAGSKVQVLEIDGATALVG